MRKEINFQRHFNSILIYLTVESCFYSYFELSIYIFVISFVYYNFLNQVTSLKSMKVINVNIPK